METLLGGESQNIVRKYRFGTAIVGLEFDRCPIVKRPLDCPPNAKNGPEGVSPPGPSSWRTAWEISPWPPRTAPRRGPS